MAWTVYFLRISQNNSIPDIGLITDTSSYYLTSDGGEVKRLEEGRINNTPSGAQIPYHIKRYDIDTVDGFQKDYDRLQNQKLYESEFSTLTGWSSQIMGRYQNIVQLPGHVYDPEVEIKYGLRLAAFYFPYPKRLKIQVQVNTHKLQAYQLNSFELINDNYSFPAQPGGFYNTVVNLLEFDDNPRFMISHLWFEYPASFNLNNNFIRYNLKEASGHITLSNIEPGRSYFIQDFANDNYGIFQSDIDSLSVSHNDAFGKYIVESLEDISRIEQFEELRFPAPFPMQENAFVVITSRRLYESTSGINAIDAYLAYRASDIGGNYNTQLVMVEDLYHHYSYGIQRHPLSIHNYCAELLSNGLAPPILIMGKGRAFSTTRTNEELVDPENETFFVPSFGFPASDPLLSSPIGEIRPRLPLGRLAVSTMDEVATYLTNLMNYEQQSPQIPSINPNWQKRIVHLSAGNALANTIRSELNKMNKVVQASPLAPEIITFYKNGTTPVDTTSTEKIYHTINEGVSAVTFFGHGSPNALGFRLDDQSKYSNAPLHPLLIALGCSAGNFNIPDHSVGEVYCLMENKGFLNLISSSSISRVSDLSFAGQALYEILGHEGDSLKIGEVLNKAIVKTLTKNRRQAGQIQLFGDPAVRLAYPKAIDFIVGPASVRTTPDFLGTELDSFSLDFDIIQQGLNPGLPISVIVSQEFPNGSMEVVHEIDITSQGYRTPVHVQIPLDNKFAAGKNRIHISLDPENKIIEDLYNNSEDNNQYIHSDDKPGFPIFIPSSSLIPLWPRNKSILPDTKISFISSTGDVLTKEAGYVLELDTTALFNGGAFHTQTIRQGGGVVEFVPVYEFKYDVVYYWRVSPIPENQDEEYYWSENQSFIMLPAKEGWNISHYYQFLETEKSGISISNSRQWIFDKSFFPVRFVNGLWNSDVQDQIGWYEYNGPSPFPTRLPWETIEEALVVMAFAHEDNQLINPRGGAFGSIPINKDKEYFAFENDEAGRDSLMFFIQHIIPDDFNIIFFTVRQNDSNAIHTADWHLDSIRNNGINIFNLLEQYGATQIRKLLQNEKVNYQSRFSKNSGHFFEDISFDDDAIISDEFTMPIWSTYGIISLDNEIIIRQDRELLEWQFGAYVDTSDSYNILYQFDDDNNKYYTHENVLHGTLDLTTLPDSVRDSAHFSSDIIDGNFINPFPAQPEYYRLYGALIGDFALSPDVHWRASKPSYLQGEPVSFSIGVQNIHHQSHSVFYRATFRQLNTNAVVATSDGHVGQAGISVDSIVIDIPLHLEGQYLVTLELNPDRDIVESTYSNNIIQFTIEIVGDHQPPVIACTFNDIVIRNGQIVSPTSAIKVTLKDENPFNLLDDTNLLSVQIEQPDGSQFPIVSGENTMFSLPGLDTSNELIMSISGDFQQEGTYTLSATGRDRASNINQVQYSVDFQIIHKSGVGFHVYPNPVIRYMYIDYVLFNDAAEVNFAAMKIFNALGKTILHSHIELQRGENTIKMEIPLEWPADTYFYQIEVEGQDGRRLAEYVDSELGYGGGNWEGRFILIRAE